MKKTLLILLILMLAASPIALSACSSVSQAQLLSTAYVCTVPGGYELFTYDVYYKTDVVGEMTLKFSPLSGEAVALPDRTEEGGEKSFSSFTGTLLSMDLQMNGVLNSDRVSSKVLYSNEFSPAYSYKKTEIGGVTKEMQVTYSSKYARTKLFVDGKADKTSRQKIKNATVFDNEMLYAIVRATKVDDSSFSLSFSTPNALTATLDQITVSRSAATEVKIKALEPKEEEVAAAESEKNAEEKKEYATPAYLFKISTGNRYASAYSMEIAKEPLTVNNDFMNVQNVKKVILKITEGDYSYILKGITIA